MLTPPPPTREETRAFVVRPGGAFSQHRGPASPSQLHPQHPLPHSASQHRAKMGECLSSAEKCCSVSSSSTHSRTSGSVEVLNPSLAGSCPGRGRRPAQATAAPPLRLRGEPPRGAAPPQRGLSHPPHVGTRPEAPIRREEEGQGERAVRRQWRL